MKKLAVNTLSLLFGATLITNAQTGYIAHDLTTGVVNGTTTPIPYGSPDDTWQMALPANPNNYSNPIVCMNPPGTWDVNSCGRWLTNKLEISSYYPHPNAPVGTIRLKTTFNMSHLCIPWAKVNLSYVGGDNMLVGFILNGYAYSITPGSSNDYNPLAQNVTINLDPSHFLLGQNVISVYVDNTGGPTGFYACGNVTIGYCPRPGEGTTGLEVEELNNAEAFTVSPNPTTGQFLLSLNKPSNGNAIVMDLMGRKVWSRDINSSVSNYAIDLSSLPKGIYSLFIRTEQGITSRKIVLK